MSPDLEMDVVRELNLIRHRLLALANSEHSLDAHDFAREAERAAGQLATVIDNITQTWPSLQHGPAR
jgi:hypothetical protein